MFNKIKNELYRIVDILTYMPELDDKYKPTNSCCCKHCACCQRFCTNKDAKRSDRRYIDHDHAE